MTKLVLVVDMQHDFGNPEGVLFAPGSEGLALKIDEYIKAQDDLHGVLFTMDTHYMPEYLDTEEGKMFPPHCIVGTQGYDLIVDAHTKNPAYLSKHVYDMWLEPDLKITNVSNKLDTYMFEYKEDDMVKHMPITVNSSSISRDEYFDNLKALGVLDVEVCGLVLNICVKAAIDGLIQRGFRVTLLKDLTVGLDIGNGDADIIPEVLFEKELADNKLVIA